MQTEHFYTKDYARDRMAKIDPRHRLSDRVMVVGLCPSSTTDVSDRSAYRKSDTVQTVLDWMHTAKCYEFDFQNVIPDVVNAVPELKGVRLDLLRARLQPFHDKKVIALGGFASKVLQTLGVKHLSVYHPSGKTRQLNDFEVRLDQVRKIHAYLKEGTK